MSDTRILKTGVPDTGCRIPGYRILTLKKGEYRIPDTRVPDTGYPDAENSDTGYRIPGY